MMRPFSDYFQIFVDIYLLYQEESATKFVTGKMKNYLDIILMYKIYEIFTVQGRKGFLMIFVEQSSFTFM